MEDPAINHILSTLTLYHDHPIPGHNFVDIFPIFRDPKSTEFIVNNLADHIRSTNDMSQITSIVCLEARGFWIGPLVAARLNLACIPIRKKGKLPGETVDFSYAKMYEVDVFEMKIDAFQGVAEGKVIVLDDLVAAGGSAVAAKNLILKLGREVSECVFLFAIPWLAETVKNAMEDTPTYAMIQLEKDTLAKLPRGQ